LGRVCELRTMSPASASTTASSASLGEAAGRDNGAEVGVAAARGWKSRFTLRIPVHSRPWNAVQRYRGDQREEEVPLQEMVCAENNEDHFNQGLVPIPQADKSEF
jgi:hypothetical protein